MYSALYVVTGVAFVVSVAAYAYFCIELSKDINSGLIPVRAETETKK
ncbi:MAG TPA: hypothetical protein VE954_43510 [Oligoflexus sp.]|nr:hypothetical protein [Oligoflexus sp.]HYX40013.1 hypothetical protein [Oligoflexus sp.]